MHDLRKLVSSANLLYTFEAAARHESFTLAAHELNVTPAAVSHAIRQFEDGIGLKLFDRQHKRVTVTPEGAKLFQNVTQALERVLSTINDLKSASSKTPVRLYVSITVATHWLLPRLARIREALPLFDLRLYTSDKLLDLPDDGMSIAITGGRGTWPGCHVWLFAKETIYPVCSPKYLRSSGAIRHVKDLRNHRLIHLDDMLHEGVTWRDWFDKFRMPQPNDSRKLVYNNYILVLQATLAAEGIALGWQHVVGDLVKQGDLIRPVKEQMSSGVDVYIVARKGRDLHPAACELRDRLIQEGMTLTG
ncbi:MAG TPA: LysR substrate-binding domain-containing protein [Nordella sp.]|nr:LysR substrate-binding domain-containing protein [Nordella sp.]